MKRIVVLLISVIVLLASFILPVSAHKMYPWKTQYPGSGANSTFSFGFHTSVHIDGNVLNYYWDNSTTKNYFNTALTTAFSQGWGDLITGTETTAANAHTKISYDPSNHPSNAAAVVYVYHDDGTVYHHIRPGYDDSEMVIYYDTILYSSTLKRLVLTHELGHLWAFDDLYDYDTTLNSLYSQPYSFNAATRHDKNGMRIAINDLWFDPGTNTAWFYQPSPGIFYERGDADLDGSVLADDSRLVLRASAGLETLTSVQSKLSDVDASGSITAEDARLILRYSSGLITKYPADG